MKKRLLNKFTHEDQRGGLKKIYNIPQEFITKQVIVSSTKKAWTVRGLHYAKEPNGESKIISCIQGSFIWVVIEALVGGKLILSSTHFKEQDSQIIYVPRGRIHGCIICEDNTLIQILSDNEYDSRSSVHYEWGDLLNKVCEVNQININQLWDSESDMEYKRVKLNYQDLILN